MKIYYFTRTGRSKKIADKIAESQGLNAIKIEDNINWKGAANYIKGGYMSSTKKIIDIECELPRDNEEIILVFPLWAATFPPAILSFIENIKRENTVAVVTSLMNTLKDRDGFKAIYDLVGKDIEAPKELLK